jgi:Mor family transcriptional regulator
MQASVKRPPQETPVMTTDHSPLDAQTQIPALDDGSLPDVLRELTAVAADELARSPLLQSAQPLTPAQIGHLAQRVILRVAAEFGGTTFYWPKFQQLDLTARDRAIYDAHDGTVDGPDGVRKLARRYPLSEKRISKILARERIRRRRG